MLRLERQLLTRFRVHIDGCKRHKHAKEEARGLKVSCHLCECRYLFLWRNEDLTVFEDAVADVPQWDLLRLSPVQFEGTGSGSSWGPFSCVS